MLQKCPLILSSLIYQSRILNMLSSSSLPTTTAVVAWPMPAGLIVFLTQCVFSSWYVWFLPVFAAAKSQGWRWQVICGGGHLLLVTDNRTRCSLLLWFVTSWVWMMSGRSEGSWFLWDLKLHSASLLPPGLAVRVLLGGELLNIMFLKDKYFDFSCKFGSLHKFLLADTLHTPVWGNFLPKPLVWDAKLE